MIDSILKDEKEEYINFMEEVGYIPKLFYDSKYDNIYSYKNYLKINLKKNLNEYIIDSKDNFKNMEEILKLLDIIKGEKLLCSKEFKDNIPKLPLKYLKITKYKIEKKILQEYSKKINNEKEENILLKYLNFLFNEIDTKFYDNIISSFFQIEEGDIKMFLDNYFERDKNSINIYGNYYETFIKEKTKFFPLKFAQNLIYVYQLKFSMLLFEDIIYEYIYDNLKKEYIFLKNLLDKGTNGGFFELLVDYYIKSSRSFIVNDIKQILYIPSIVPQNYSINYYSSKRKKEKFVEFNLRENKNKRKKIPFANAYLKQTIFNSKYYDMGLLIKSNNDLNKKAFNLVVIQASIKKEPIKRMSKDEHELILSIVKQNIENGFDIEIKEAYFVYVLSQENNKIVDGSTQKYCDKNGISYLGFELESIKNISNNESDKYLIDLSNAFITKLFPNHNSASLLIYNKKEKNEYIKLRELINNNLKFSQSIEKTDFDIIKDYIKNKFEPKDITEKQFKYFPLKIIDNIGNFIINYLTDFCFIISDIKSDFNMNRCNQKNEKGFIHAFGKSFQINNFQIVNPLKIDNNSIVKFFYSTTPLELIKN